jgi:parallel beta-helix repeat protein
MKSRYSLILLTMGLGLTLALILLWKLGGGSVLAAAARVPASVPRTDRTLKPSRAGMARDAVEGLPVAPSAPATVTELYVCNTCLYTTVQAAVDVAHSEDVIKVATGVYTGVSARYGTTQVVYIDKGVVMRGGYTTSDWDHADPEANPVTLDAEGRGRALYATVDVSITLEGLRFTGGDAAQGGGDNYGGGMYVDSARGIITGCRIYSNTAERGGGVYLFHSPATLEGNTITTNTAERGGGVYLHASPATLDGNTVIINTATGDDVYDGGGGVYLYESPATIDGNTVFSNTTKGRGGGVHLHRSDATLDGNTLTSNEASDFGGGAYLYDSDAAALNGNRVMSNTVDQSGGGLYLHNSDATLDGNTMSGNTAVADGGGLCVVSNSGAALSHNTIVSSTASGSGGGLYVRSSEPTLVNNVVADNVADTSGGGIYVYGDSNPRLLHTTIARNRGGEGSGVCVSHSGSDYSTIVLVNTILVSHTVGITVAAGDRAILTATLWHGNTIADWGGSGHILTGTLAHNHWGAPAFVSPTNGDYHITAGSAARDTGVDAGVDTDIDGEPRPQGSGHDIGADEHWPCIPMTGVEITGKFTTTAGVGTVFTAAVHPPTVMLPITYTWEATGQPSLTQSGGISHTAVFTWHGAGARVVTVTAVNACGPVVSRTHVVTIEATLCNALTDLDLDGPLTATVDVATVFTATVTPSDAAQPVSYTWEATGQISVGHSGGISDTAAFTWSVSGPQIVTATAVNKCGPVVSKTRVITVEAETCNALTDLGVNGPPTTTVDVPTIFTAIVIPSEAAQPVTYTWEATGQTSATHSSGISDTAVLTWSITGPQIVTVTAVNECGVAISQAHAITVEVARCIGLTDGGISGPREGYTDTLYVFAAVITPSSASEPITYTWTPGPDSGQGTDSASYTWFTTGTKVITLTAENCGGMFAAIHTITISATQSGCPKPLSDVGITGPTSGYTGTAYGFSAAITPSDATEPVTYDWTPEPDNGQGTKEVTYSWATTGNKTVSVEVENCGGSASDDHTVSIRGLSDEFVYLPLVLRSQ